MSRVTLQPAAGVYAGGDLAFDNASYVQGIRDGERVPNMNFPTGKLFLLFCEIHLNLLKRKSCVRL